MKKLLKMLFISAALVVVTPTAISAEFKPYELSEPGTKCSTFGATTRCSDGTTYIKSGKTTRDNKGNSWRSDGKRVYGPNGNIIINNDKEIRDNRGNSWKRDLKLGNDRTSTSKRDGKHIYGSKKANCITTKSLVGSGSKTVCK